MPKITGAKCRICRRTGLKLYLKGIRCYTAKCAVEKGSLAPGQRRQRKARLTDYGLHLREVQRAKKSYGVLMRQFKRFFSDVCKEGGNPAEGLICRLERRLDNVIYRLGFALSRAHARQLIKHEHIRVNGHRITIPSYLVQAGDLITPEDKKKSLNLAKESLTVRKNIPEDMPSWLKIVKEEPPTGQVVQLPDPNETQIQFESHLIIEFLTK